MKKRYMYAHTYTYIIVMIMAMSVMIVMPDVRIPEREERRLPRQCNSQKKGSLLLTRVRAPAAHPTQWYEVREH